MAPIEVVAIVTSPLQVQNAIQYLRQFDIDPACAAVVHVESSSEDNNALSRNAIAQLEWGATYSIRPFKSVPAPRAQRQGWIARRLGRIATRRERAQDDPQAHAAWVEAETENRRQYMEAVRAIADVLARQPVTKLLLGDYRPVSFRQFLRFFDFQTVECVLLDDGSVSRYVMAFRVDGKHKDEVLGHLPTPLGPDDPFEIVEPSAVTFFSIYEQPVADSDRIVLNAKYASLGERQSVDEVWVIGANHAEAGIAKRREYLKLCRKAARWFRGHKVVYFPHRNESSAKLDEITRATGFEIRRTAGGIEDYVLHERVEPRLVVAFGSTVVDTLSRVFAPSWRVAVIVPGTRYFTRSRRAEHVRRIIRDNIRQNSRVIGVPGHGRGVREWFEALLSAGGLTASEERVATAPAESGAEQAPPVVTRVKRFTRTDTEPGWETYRETPEHGIHRLWLGRFDHGATPRLHHFRIRSEGRSNFTLRVAYADQPEEFVQVRIDVDRPRNYLRRGRHGFLGVHVDTDWRRESTVTVFFRGFHDRPIELQMFARQRWTGGDVRYLGREAAGFSIGHVMVEPSLAGQHHVEFDADFAQIDIQAVLTKGAAHLTASAGAEMVRFIAHSGWLNDLGAREVESGYAEGAHVKVIGPVGGRRMRAERGEIKDLGLNTTVQLRLERVGETVHMYTSDGHHCGELPLAGHPELHISSTAPFYVVRREGDGRQTQSARARVPFHLAV